VADPRAVTGAAWVRGSDIASRSLGPVGLVVVDLTEGQNGLRGMEGRARHRERVVA
jgi:hypothetical protein